MKSGSAIACLPRRGELVERGHQSLGHEPPTEVAEPPGGVGSLVGHRLAHRDLAGVVGRAFIAATAAGRVTVLDQGLADQHHVGAQVGVAGGVCGATDARLGDADDGVGDQPHQPGEGVAVDLEGLEVAGVDPDDVGPHRQGALDLDLVVDLGQHGQPERAGLVVQLAEQPVVERGHDQQHQVGSRGAGLEQLVAGHHEVLAQERRRDGRADSAEVVQAATEAALLGEHGDRVGTARGVRRGERGRVGDLGQVALAGRAPLDLRDHREAGRPERRDRVERRGHRLDQGTEVGLAALRATVFEVLAHASDDVVEHGHAGPSRSTPPRMRRGFGASHQGSHTVNTDRFGPSDAERGPIGRTRKG